ncbi:trypsin-like serine protease [Rheinheimera sp. 1928-s]|uniref:trypsin-like serine protease n=1 Tax=Rheinheimera sp. 1928-s TaxID=3033803 RepID=UPI0026385D00|nr:trypsin-like serine protease [Rheinheimera sp. 1928-s]MDF3127269.1 trypsin-like serine protease [Rheinheimera sp. 1928-s]
MPQVLLFTLLALSFSLNAIVIRHDVDDSKYRIQATEFPALADMPVEGHGVLIAPQWIITAAHAITWQAEIKQVMVGGTPRVVERIEIHPGYKAPPKQLLEQALATWDWTLFRVLLASSDDIALLKLAKPITDVVPASIFSGNSEFGQIVKVIGKGATGNGLSGYEFSDPHRTELRRAYNKVTSADGRWICYLFDNSVDALPLEGGSGNGDSGGPVLIEDKTGWLLAGLTSWTDLQSTNRTPGRYGQVTCNVRLNHYKQWIQGVMSGQP